MILAGRHDLISVVYKHTSLHVFFPPYLSSQYGIIQRKYTQMHSVFCKVSFAKNELDTEQITDLQGRLSDVFGGLFSSCV